MGRPQISALQLAWLQEVGMDRRLLARLVDLPRPQAPDSAPQGPTSAAALSASAPHRVVADEPAAGKSEAQTADSRSGIAAARAMLDAGKTGKRHASAGKAKLPAAQRMPVVSDAPQSDPIAPESSLPHTLDQLDEHIVVCQACSLHEGRSHVVHGSGQTIAPEWMLIGEAPGEQDDRVGLPFQGSAGVLLRAMLETVGVGAGASVFMTNLIKCRPLGNRTPRPEEIAACQPYLLRQIELLQPVRIVALGRLAAQALLGADADLERLRGKVHVLTSESGRQIPLIVTYHPASLLSRPQHKANAWRDLHLALSV
jgi:DNA polymerase